jgi:hypothetical protein
MHTKTGLDYFPFDVDFFNDDKIQLISAEHNIVGEIIIIKLLCKVYQNGYFYKCGEDEIKLLAHSLRNGTRSEQVLEIINSAVQRNIFNKELYEEYSILTSSGIQKRFIEATGRRKNVNILRTYWLLNDKPKSQNVHILEGTNDPKISSKMKPYGTHFDSSDAQNVDTLHTSCIHFEPECTHDVDSLPQSKVKESKVKSISKVIEYKPAVPFAEIQSLSGKYNDLLLKIFQQRFYESRGFIFAGNSGRDKENINHVAKKVIQVKESHSGKKLDTMQALSSFDLFVTNALTITEKFIFNNMSPGILESKFTAILTLVRGNNFDGTKPITNYSTSSTDEQAVAEIYKRTLANNN